MKHKFTTPMLLISTLLLGAFIWFVDLGSENSLQQAQRNKMLFAVYPDTINWIQLERNDVKFECSKASGDWRLIQPADAPVNIAIVKQMIAGMTNVERGELITAKTLQDRGFSPSTYGFDEPRAKITFRNNKGTFTWLIGNDAPLGEMLYVMSSESDDIIAAPQALLHLVPEDPAWIRDKTLFSASAPAVRGVDLRRENGLIQLRQSDVGEWMMQEPQVSRANLSRAHALIEEILSAQIRTFITDEKTDLILYGLKDPAYELTLFTQDEQTQTLWIGDPLAENPEIRYAKWIESDAVFSVSSEWVATFEQDSDTLRSRQLLNKSAQSITQLNIEHDGQDVELLQTNQTWKITRPARWETEPTHVALLLASLEMTVIEEFVDLPTAEQTALIQDDPWIITFKIAEQTHTLRISKIDADGRRLVQRDEEASLFFVDAGLVHKSFANPIFYRNLTVLSVDPLEIKTLSLQTKEQTSNITREADAFISADPLRKVDVGDVTNLIAELTHLRAKHYVDFNPESLEPYGLDHPDTKLSLTLKNTETLGQIIHLGEETQIGRFAKIQGQELVFDLSEETVEILTRNLTEPIETPTEEIERP